VIHLYNQYPSSGADMSYARIAAIAVVVVAVLAFQLPARGDWVNITDPLVAQLTADNKKPAWPGQSAGVAVDRTTGALFVIIPGQGLFKSTDRGATFARCDDGKVTGRCETAYSLHPDPNTSRMACFQLDGKCGLTLDGGKTWQPFKDVGRNWDFAAVDWSAQEPKTIYGARHESGGEMYVSTDAGESWTQLDKDEKYFALGVADANTFLTSKGEGLLRSTDQGKTWAKVSDLTPISRVMQTMSGTHYFFATVPPPAVAAADPKQPKKPAGPYQSVLIVSKDKGATWARQGAVVDAAWGPYFGKDEKHLVTLGKRGMIIESTDAGETWKEVVQVPKGCDTGRPGWFTNLAYDPTSDTFYVSRMGFPAFKWERK
jgi:photosystem II stability/assembly factor-like uncharacterized protein